MNDNHIHFFHVNLFKKIVIIYFVLVVFFLLRYNSFTVKVCFPNKKRQKKKLNLFKHVNLHNLQSWTYLISVYFNQISTIKLFKNTQ